MQLGVPARACWAISLVSATTYPVYTDASWLELLTACRRPPRTPSFPQPRSCPWGPHVQPNAAQPAERAGAAAG